MDKKNNAQTSQFLISMGLYCAYFEIWLQQQIFLNRNSNCLPVIHRTRFPEYLDSKYFTVPTTIKYLMVPNVYGLPSTVQKLLCLKPKAHTIAAVFIRIAFSV